MGPRSPVRGKPPYATPPASTPRSFIAEGDQAFIDDVLDFQNEIVRSAKILARTRSCASRNQQMVSAARLLLTGCRLALRYWPLGTDTSRTVHVHDALRQHILWPPAHVG